jgi:hypothetical protein
MGFGFGNFIGNAVFLTLESAKFCNRIRPFFGLESQSHGILTAKSMINF